ncbi:alpha-amylase family glycosyl hydrolase [Gaetbulibacter sp. M235]|uniref:alpha-amylase family glycosyl hydrolase n=1 Tax=Gaetbulibacter sp. M235 TaxID=3126510 RepID=UPI00374F1080
MKKITFIFLIFITSFSFAQTLSWQGGITPGETDSAVLLFDATGTPLQSYTGVIYAHTGVTLNDTTHWQNVIGSWNNNSTQPALTLVSGEIYSLNITPSIKEFYNNPAGTITAIDFVLRSADGNTQTADLNISVGAFQLNLTSPTSNPTILTSGGNLLIEANNTNGIADYTLKANGVVIDNQSSITSYSYTHSNITSNQNYALEVTQNTTTKVRNFSVVVNPNIPDQALPAGLVDGINYNAGDATKATLVIDAPSKDFIYVAGSFNSWQPDATYAMKKDTSSTKFWLELTGLTPGQLETYQYWIVDQNPIANSPALVKVADPFSTLVLSSYDDPGIPSGNYPNLPTYPNTGNPFEVTVLKTGQAPYNWQVTNFSKPKKDDLIVYEVLVRDFDANRNYQDLIDKIDYFKNLNVNAIELMPVMEYEGNESWGYNTAFHMALDKFYGTEDKLRELIDVCHQNGIAVILDIALNHAFGRNPMVRMWMDDPDGNGYGGPTSENPYFNTVAKHSYNVGNDFNHSSALTKNYVKSVIKHWIEDFKIDGFRWDLTKGFTQNCTESDEGCTGSYQADRVAILKEYVDYSWSLDPTHYAIFEHLGSDAEEKEWANYKFNEGKGVMMWGKMTDQYGQLTTGNASNYDISRMGYKAHTGFLGNRVMGYAESHDEERLMYKNIVGGKSNANYNIKDLNTALSRMSALGVVTIPIPGPKMIWHFGELGMENSIFTCTDGSYNTDCKLATKPQPQWAENWLADDNRNAIYKTWSRLNELKISEAVFEGDYSITTNTLTPKIHVWDNTLPTTDLKDVIIIANFDIVSKNVAPDFPYTGTWYSLLDRNSPLEVTNMFMAITLAPGEYKVFGNKPHVDPDDLDGDGVPNANDNCPNTPLGASVDVNGCEVFSLPANNFSIQVNSETCRNSNNGSINITANQNLNYTAHIVGNGVNLNNAFTTTYTAGNLQAGNYEVCITVEGQPDYEQCFNVSVTEPEDISVISKVDNTKNSVSLTMSGSSVYKVTLNGVTTQTKNFTIELELSNGTNMISVEGEKICQGIYEETIFYGNDLKVFPNPISDNILKVYLGHSKKEMTTITIYSIIGNQVYSTKTNENYLEINTIGFSKGIYILNVNTKEDNKSLKIIKN